MKQFFRFSINFNSVKEASEQFEKHCHSFKNRTDWFKTNNRNEGKKYTSKDFN